LRTFYYTHACMLGHEMGPGHPESPERLRAIETALASEKFLRLERREAPRAAPEDLARAHRETYLKALEAASPAQGHVMLEADALLNPQTLEAARYAAGGAVAAVDAVMTGAADTAFVAARPPGHHAGAASPMGFCFLNNVAIAARSAVEKYDAARVAIVDFDVHHGNGTQEIFWSDKNVLFCSTHQAPFYPGTGGRNETGAHNNIVNAPLFAGSDGDAFAEAFVDVILPRVKAFAPDLILVSAGFDAHADDPLGGLKLQERDYSEATKRLLDLADRFCERRIVSLLEGGYDLDALGASVAAHVAALMGG
jgi:acetoin utilization deacetylase AcuC-like enzyme